MAAPMLVSRDPVLVEEVQRLAAAAGAPLDAVTDEADALRGWPVAPLLLVGADAVSGLAAVGPPRRDGLLVVAPGVAPPEVLRAAVVVGAEQVVELPAAGEWLVERLTDLEESRARPGAVVGVLGGSGGAGATTFACALGQVASRQGPAVVVDLDPLGPGVQRVLGLEATAGVRWAELGRTTGRLAARSLREALPRAGGPAVLGWGEGPRAVDPGTVREALSAARRGHDVVVVDLPRGRDPVSEEVAARCDHLVLVTRPSVTGAASATRVGARLPPGRVGLVVRGRGLPAADLARVTAAPVLAVMPDQRGLAEAVDLGLGPARSRRGPLARAAREVLHALGSGT